MVNRTDRPWYAIRLVAVLELVAVAMIALALLATLVVRERIAAIPEIGHATSMEELRAAWAEAEAEAATELKPKSLPLTMPKTRQDIRP